MENTYTFVPKARTLLGPGPSDVSPRVLKALSRPTIGHLDPQFIELMDDIKRLLQYAFKTSNALTIPVSAPGSAGMEACFVNLVEPGDKVVVCVNGVFGARMVENVTRCGGIPVVVEDEWGRPINLQKVEDALLANKKVKALAFVHAETSTGVRNDAKALCEMSRRFDSLSIVDAVTSLGGIEVDVDGWGVDAIYSGSQKCLSSVPGLSPISFSPRAVEVIQKRSAPVQSWFLDMKLIVSYWGQGNQRAYHHTAPVNSLYALHEALLILEEEGLEHAWRRHASCHALLVEELRSIGLTLAVEEPYRLPQLNTVRIPAGVEDAAVRARLLNEFNLEIGAGLGALAKKVWRIGLMGHACSQKNVEHCVASLKQILESR